MSGGASFAQFFPSAPRAAKDKAKEREKVKSSQIQESPKVRAANAQAVLTNSLAIIDDAGLNPRGSSESKISPPEVLPTSQADDNESLQGDLLLNGVGSASSHASTVSSVFSASAPHSNNMSAGGSKNTSSLTPLTNIDSSPNRVTSPRHHKSGVPSSGLAADTTTAPHDVPQAQPALAEPEPTTPRIFARDPNIGIKGIKCTYDPLTDKTISSSKHKKSKVVYKEFGLVRIQSAGSVILFV